MFENILNNPERGRKLILYPILIGIAAVLVSYILYPEPGMLGITLLFAMMVSVSPYTLWKYFRVKRIKAMEKEFPNFARDLVEAKKSGLTLTEALRDATKNEYGELNKEVDKMAKQLSWNMSFDEVMTRFSERVSESDLMRRTIKIIMEAKKSGGNIISAMETVSSDTSTLIEMEEERKSKMSQHAAVMYIIYFMFVAVTIMLSKILVPLTEEMDLGEEALMFGGEGGEICQAPMQITEEVICSLFQTIGRVMTMAPESGAYYDGLFLSMVVVQGILTGPLIGQIRDNSASSGIKYSFIMTAIGMVAYVVASRYIEIGII